MSKKHYIIPAVMAIVAMAVGVIWYNLRKSGERADATPSAHQNIPSQRAKSTTAIERKSGNQKNSDIQDRDSNAYDDFPKRDRELAESLQTALDKEDYTATIMAATEALKSAKSELRLQAVEALGWFGKKALAELTPCMADPDEEVAQAAEAAWELALSEIDSSKERFDISLLALTTISSKDALEMIGTQFSNAATDLIDDSDEQDVAGKRVEIIQTVVDMICSDNPARSEAACEVYENITGHEWINLDEAELYLSDPDNYEDPEARGQAVQQSNGGDA